MQKNKYPGYTGLVASVPKVTTSSPCWGIGCGGFDNDHDSDCEHMNETYSNVFSPQHYAQGYIETIYVIEQTLGPEGFKAYCMGNYLKYKARHEHKNGKEDLEKAEVYLGWAVNGLPKPVNGRLPKNN